MESETKTKSFHRRLNILKMQVHAYKDVGIDAEYVLLFRANILEKARDRSLFQAPSYRLNSRIAWALSPLPI